MEDFSKKFSDLLSQPVDIKVGTDVGGVLYTQVALSDFVERLANNPEDTVYADFDECSRKGILRQYTQMLDSYTEILAGAGYFHFMHENLCD